MGPDILPIETELVPQSELLAGGFTPEELAALRAEFPILEGTTYLISGSLGAMPRAVADELANFAGTWARRGVRAWSEGWWETSTETGDLIAPLLGVGRGEVAMHQNASVAAAVFLSALDYPAARPKLITLELDFPSLHYVLAGERRKGAEVTMLAGEGNGVGIDLERLLAAIDERTRLVAVSHALFRSSFLLDAAAVAKRCREVGALLLLDVYQTTGVVPVELAAWGVDAAVGGSVKWLCGGPGNGYLWVRPDLARTLAPTITGWQADREPFAFRPGEVDPAEGAWRLLTGTPNVPAHVAARPGYRIMAGLGAERIRARSLTLTERVMRAIAALPDELGLSLHTPQDERRRGGMVTVGHPAAGELCQAMIAQEVIVDHRPGAGIRFGPHVYTSEEECDRAVALLAHLADRRLR